MLINFRGLVATTLLPLGSLYQPYQSYQTYQTYQPTTAHRRPPVCAVVIGGQHEDRITRGLKWMLNILACQSTTAPQEKGICYDFRPSLNFVTLALPLLVRCVITFTHYSYIDNFRATQMCFFSDDVWISNLVIGRRNATSSMER